MTHPSFQACLETNPPAENLLSPRAHDIQAPAAMTVEPWREIGPSPTTASQPFGAR
ncbi:protein of unknown function [Micropruina glycogenica]|uniref:Uncharacterized protein n=1 Tax=Micropruina glycogenica TaxID=75385 RepID=A0A2N9JKG0_9ACTN|nr:protein of unknown function [Micropruina glycogenica]